MRLIPKFFTSRFRQFATLTLKNLYTLRRKPTLTIVQFLLPLLFVALLRIFVAVWALFPPHHLPFHSLVFAVPPAELAHPAPPLFFPPLTRPIPPSPHSFPSIHFFDQSPPYGCGPFLGSFCVLGSPTARVDLALTFCVSLVLSAFHLLTATPSRSPTSSPIVPPLDSLCTPPYIPLLLTFHAILWS